MSEKRSVNLCSIYVLPLLGLNRWSFDQPGNFVSSYVNEDDTHIVVECRKPFSNVIIKHANYKFSFEKEGKYFGVFEAPVGYSDDLKKFREGKYSKLSDAAKNLIRRKSGLTYKVPMPNKGGYKSALELLALDKDKELKKYWEEQLSNPTSPVVLDEEAELVSIPGEDNFYELKLSTQLEGTVYGESETVLP